MLKIKAAVTPIVNRHLGDTITAAGLLMGADILAQLQESGCGHLVTLPRVTFDHPEVISLDDITPQAIADELGRPVALVDTLGDVWDALTGASRLLYWPR